MSSHHRPSLKGKAPIPQPNSIPITLSPSMSDTSSSDLDFPTYTCNPIPLPTTPTPSKKPQAILEDLTRQISAAASLLETRTLHDAPLTTSALASFLRKMQVGLVSAAKGMERAEARRVEDLRVALDEQDARRLEHELEMRGQREAMRREVGGYRKLYSQRIQEMHGRLRQEVDDCQREHLQKLQECERRFDELQAAREEAEEKAAISIVTADEIMERMKKKHDEETKVLEVKVEGLENQLEEREEREKEVKGKEKEKEKQEKVKDVKEKANEKANARAKVKEQQQQHVAAPVAGKKRKATPIDEGDGGTTERKSKRSKRHRRPTGG